MKTNTFIFNFINQSRLVYFAREAPSAPSAEPEVPASDTAEEATEAATEATEAARAAAETSQKQRIEQTDLARAATEATEAARKSGRDFVIDASNIGEIINRVKQDNIDPLTGVSIPKKTQRQLDYADPWAETADTNKSARKIDKDNPWSSEINENAVETILAGKKNDLVKILNYFTEQGYSKGMSGLYNIEILNILGKKNESSENRIKWIKAFQEWAGAGGDGKVGPNTMAALADKIGASNLEQRINRTMIARRDKKPFVPDMDFTDPDFLAQTEIEDPDLHAFYKELKERRDVTEYSDKISAAQEAYPGFDNLTHKQQTELLNSFHDLIEENPNDNQQQIASKVKQLSDSDKRDAIA